MKLVIKLGRSVHNGLGSNDRRKTSGLILEIERRTTVFDSKRLDFGYPLSRERGSESILELGPFAEERH